MSALAHIFKVAAPVFEDHEETTNVRSVSIPASEPQPIARKTSRGDIVGQHHALMEVLETLDRVAHSTCTVLVTGESGTGKELVVAALHDASPRQDAPFVAVNCGAIPLELVESELFGHAKGAFTGAHAARRGHVAMADGGTLFLDEVGELPLQVQVKLLRLLQSREYTPVGESKPVKCDVRIVAATHRDLEAEVAAGRFREDLYYRLNVVHVHLPALRERAEDIPVLAAHFMKASATRAGRTDIEGFSDEAMIALCKDEWNGNIRALENTIERATLLAKGNFIALCDLPSKFRGARPTSIPAPPESGTYPILPNEGMDLGAAVEQYENALIRQALERTGGNKNRAAQLLNLNRTTLVEMVKRKKIWG